MSSGRRNYRAHIPIRSKVETEPHTHIFMYVRTYTPVIVVAIPISIYYIHYLYGKTVYHVNGYRQGHAVSSGENRGHVGVVYCARGNYCT